MPDGAGQFLVRAKRTDLGLYLESDPADFSGFFCALPAKRSPEIPEATLGHCGLPQSKTDARQAYLMTFYT